MTGCVFLDMPRSQLEKLPPLAPTDSFAVPEIQRSKRSLSSTDLIKQNTIKRKRTLKRANSAGDDPSIANLLWRHPPCPLMLGSAEHNYKAAASWIPQGFVLRLYNCSYFTIQNVARIRTLNIDAVYDLWSTELYSNLRIVKNQPQRRFQNDLVYRFFDDSERQSNKKTNATESVFKY